MRLHLTAMIHRADSRVEVKEVFTSTPQWIKDQKNMGKVVMREIVDNKKVIARYFAGDSEEDIFDWYALNVSTERHLELEVV